MSFDLSFPSGLFDPGHPEEGRVRLEGESPARSAHAFELLSLDCGGTSKYPHDRHVVCYSLVAQMRLRDEAVHPRSHLIGVRCCKNTALLDFGYIGQRRARHSPLDPSWLRSWHDQLIASRAASCSGQVAKAAWAAASPGNTNAFDAGQPARAPVRLQGSSRAADTLPHRTAQATVTHGIQSTIRDQIGPYCSET